MDLEWMFGAMRVSKSIRNMEKIATSSTEFYLTKCFGMNLPILQSCLEFTFSLDGNLLNLRYVKLPWVFIWWKLSTILSTMEFLERKIKMVFTNQLEKCTVGTTFQELSFLDFKDILTIMPTALGHIRFYEEWMMLHIWPSNTFKPIS